MGEKLYLYIVWEINMWPLMDNGVRQRHIRTLLQLITRVGQMKNVLNSCWMDVLKMEFLSYEAKIAFFIHHKYLFFRSHHIIIVETIHIGSMQYLFFSFFLSFFHVSSPPHISSHQFGERVQFFSFSCFFLLLLVLLCGACKFTVKYDF